MAILYKTDLEMALEKIFQHMESKGIKLNPDRKNEIKEQIADSLDGKMSDHDLNDPNVQKKLLGCITALIMNKKEDYNALVNELDSDARKDELEEKYTNQLLAQLLFLTVLTNIINQKISNENQMPVPAAEIERQLDKYLDENPDLDMDMKASIKDYVKECWQTLYGNGVQFQPGNGQGIPNVTIPNPNSAAFMVDANTYNSNKPYQGLEIRVLLNYLKEGINLRSSPSLTQDNR